MLPMILFCTIARGKDYIEMNKQSLWRLEKKKKKKALTHKSLRKCPDTKTKSRAVALLLQRHPEISGQCHRV